MQMLIERGFDMDPLGTDAAGNPKRAHEALAPSSGGRVIVFVSDAMANRYVGQLIGFRVIDRGQLDVSLRGGGHDMLPAYEVLDGNERDRIQQEVHRLDVAERALSAEVGESSIVREASPGILAPATSRPTPEAQQAFCQRLAQAVCSHCGRSDCMSIDGCRNYIGLKLPLGVTDSRCTSAIAAIGADECRGSEVLPPTDCFIDSP
jgi:hypothetical protein